MAMLDKNYPVFGLYFRRYAPFARFGRFNPLTFGFGYFEGDDRGVSQAPWGVTSRTYGKVMFNRFGPGEIWAGSSGTEFHPAIGAVIHGMAKVNHTLVRNTINGPDRFGFRANTAGSNPLVPASPDINTYVDAVIDFGLPNYLRISGQAFGDNFPNLEIFLLCYRSSHSALLLDGQTSGGPNLGPATRLFGASESYSLGSFSASLVLDQNGQLVTNSTVGPTKMPG